MSQFPFVFFFTANGFLYLSPNYQPQYHECRIKVRPYIFGNIGDSFDFEYVFLQFSSFLISAYSSMSRKL